MEYILGGVIVALLVERLVTQRTNAREREDLIRALLSKDVREYSDSKVVEQTPKDEEVKPPEYQPVEDLDNDQFMNAIYGKKSN